MGKSGVLRFMEKAMRWRIFRGSVRAIKTRNANIDPEHLQSVVDSAVNEVRSEYRSKGRAAKS